MLFADPREHDPADLVDAFLTILSARPDADPHRVRNAGGFVGGAVGGDPAKYTAVGDDPPVPGSVLADRQAAGLTVTDAEWCSMLRERLLALVAAGVEPAFLVRSLAHYVTDWYRFFANTGETDEKRARSRQGFYDIADDPVKLADFRARIRNDNSTQSDDDVAHELRRIGDKLAPVSAEEALERWASLEAWQRDVAELLSTD